MSQPTNKSIKDWEERFDKMAQSCVNVETGHIHWDSLVCQGTFKTFITSLVQQSKEEARRQMIREFFLSSKIMTGLKPLAVLRGVITADEMKLLDSLSNPPKT